MSALQFWSPASCDTVPAPSAASPSPSAPKRVLSLLLKIQPWGNAKSARLRAILGLSGPYTASFAPSVQAAEGQPQAGCMAKEAWLANGDLNGDGCVVLEVTDGDTLRRRKARAISRTPAAAVRIRLRPSCRISMPSGCSNSDDTAEGGNSDDDVSELGLESASIVPLCRATAAASTASVAAVPPAPPAPQPQHVGPAVAALEGVTARRRRRKQEEAAAAAVAVAEASAAALPPNLPLSNSKCHIAVHREPLHPNWLVGNRRAAFTGTNSRSWLPLHVLAQAQAHAQAQLLPAANSPRSSTSDNTVVDGGVGGGIGGGGTGPSSPTLSQYQQPQQQQGQLQPSGVGIGCSSPAVSLTQMAVGGGGGGSGAGGTNSRASSTHSERREVTRSGASGFGSPSPMARMDSLTGSSPSASLASLQQMAQSGFIPSERDRDRDREEGPGAPRLGPMQGLLRGSRMQGHVTAVANPAYVAVAAAATAALAAAVGGGAVLPAAAGPGLSSGPSAALLKEPSRRRYHQASPIELEPPLAAALVVATAAGSDAPSHARLPAAAFPVSCSATGGAGAGSSGGALRPSLAQQRDAAAATAAAVAAAVMNSAQRPAVPAAVVATGLQGHAVALRPGSPYQLSYPSHPYHHHHHHNSPQTGSTAVDPVALSQVAAQPQAVAASSPLAATSVGGASGQPPLPAPATAAIASSACGSAAASAPAGTSPPRQPSFSQHLAISKHFQRRSSNGNYNISIQQPQHQPAQQQTSSAQSCGSGDGSIDSTHRQPSMTENGNARTQLPRRPTDDWTPLLPDGGGGGSNGKGRDMPVSSSTSHLRGMLTAAAATAASDGPAAAADDAAAAIAAKAGGQQIAMAAALLASPPQLFGIPSDAPTPAMATAAPSSSAAAAAAGACGAQPGAGHTRPTSSVAAVRPVSTPPGVATGGSSGVGATGNSSTAWLSGGVSLLQALASGSDAGGNQQQQLHRHHHHHHHHRNGGHGSRNNHRPPRAPLPAGGTSIAGGDGGGGGSSYSGMAPGRGSGAPRPHGRRVH